MKRRIMLMAGSVMMLLVAFALYSLIVGSGNWKPATAPVRPLPSPTDPNGSLEGDRGRGLHIETRDKDDRITGVYMAEQWNKQPDGGYKLIKPRIEVHQKSDRRAIITADQGVIYAERIKNGFNPRRGSLNGDVHIVFEGYASDRGPAGAGRGQDVITVAVEDLRFDNDMLRLQTDGPVKITSSQVQLEGTGLTISWNELPRELRLMRLEQGHEVRVFQMPSDMAMPIMGGQASANAPASRPVAAAPRKKASSSAPTSPREPVDITLAQASQKPARNVYRIEFVGREKKVDVDFGANHLRGADRLSLIFDWSDKSDSSQNRRTPASSPATAPATQGRGQDARRGQPAGAGATSAPSTPQAGEMIVTWSGPMEITPVGYTPTPSPDHYRVEGRGDRVVLDSNQSRAVCKQFYYDTLYRDGNMGGSDSEPAWLASSDGLEIVNKDMRFDDANGLVYLVGPGCMLQNETGGSLPSADSPPWLGEHPRTKSSRSIITWSDAVAAQVGVEKFRDSFGKEKTGQTIKKASFYGDIHMNNTQDGSFVNCDQMHVEMARSDATGKPYPRKGNAIGHVVARQDKADIKAESLIIGFDEVDTANSSGDQVLKIKATEMVSDGNVLIHEIRDDGNTITAASDHLVANLLAQTATLTGTPQRPATVTQGPNKVVGREIRVEERDGAKSVLIQGAGGMDFISDRDMDSRKLDKARPVNITWLDRMDYDGRSNKAVFDGDVLMHSGPDSMACRRLTLTFQEAAPATKPAARPSGSDRQVRLGMDDFGGRKITMMAAEKDVKLIRREEIDANGRAQLQQQLTFMGNDMRYYPPTGMVQSGGAGRFLVEDYRPPRADKAAAGESADMQSPYQAAFEWQNSMEFQRKDRQVLLDGNVNMVYASGAQIVVPEELAGNLPDSLSDRKQLPEGRKTFLRSEKMAAQFNEANSSPSASKPANGDSLNMGSLKSFQALGGKSRIVNVLDGTAVKRDIRCQRLIYEGGGADTVTVWGYLADNPKANAIIYQEDVNGGTLDTIKSPMITWTRKNNRFETEEITGAGGK